MPPTSNSNDRDRDFKSRARDSASARTARPGAVPVGPAVAMIHGGHTPIAAPTSVAATAQRVGGMADMEDRVAAKIKSQPVSSSHHREQEDIAVKRRVAAGNYEGGGIAATVPLSSSLERLELDVEAKMRARAAYSTSANNTAGTATSYNTNNALILPRSHLHDLENAVAAKTRADQTSRISRESGQSNHSPFLARDNGPGAQISGSSTTKRECVSKSSAVENEQNDDKAKKPDHRQQEHKSNTSFGTDSKDSGEMSANKSGPSGSAPCTRDKMILGDSASDDNVFTDDDTDIPTITTDHGRMQEGDLEYGIYGTGSIEGLAIAKPVDISKEEEDMPVSFGVEYDPDNKPPIYRNRRFRLYTFLAFFVLVVVAIGATLGVSLTKDNVSAEAERKKHPREELGIKDQVEAIVGATVLEETKSAYARALDWITFDDQLQLTPAAPNFIQRYFAAYFYFATSVDHPWDSCNPPTASENSTCLYGQLVALNPIQRIYVPWTRWLSEEAECKWAGMFCDDFDQVRAIDLTAANLSGFFPAGVQHFPYLQSLNIPWGQLRGPLPVDLFASLKHLVSLEIQYNSFTGPIPAEWSEKPNYSLQALNMGDNQITGSIPKGLSNMKALKGLFLFNNKLNGSIPKEIGDMTILASLRMSRNEFTGTIPTEVGNVVALSTIRMQGNKLVGTIPTEIGNIRALDDLRLHQNPELSGTIPEEMFEKTSLMSLLLSECSLTGTLSPKVSNWTQMKTLRLHENKFWGDIPSSIGEMPFLQSFTIHGNGFEGEMPAEICKQVGQSLKVLDADCAPGAESDFVKVQCADDCCTRCCNIDGECL